MFSTVLSAFTLWAAGSAFAPAFQPAPKAPTAAAPVDDPRFPYDRFTTRDRLGRTITFYLSKPAKDEDGTLKPLILCVQGSGSQSIFQKVETPDGPRIASGGPEAVILSQFRAKARILVVEKPGVAFLVQPQRPGSAEEASEEFRREHTLDRWVEALRAAVSGAVDLPGVDAAHILALGHSEGGQVVCHLAQDPRFTHIASLAGGGPTQLFDLIELARSGGLGLPQPRPEERAAWVVDQWRAVLADPDAPDKDFLGHPHRRWTSFLRTSPAHAITQGHARIFLAQGTRDTATLPASTDMLYAELLARGRDVTYERVEGGDHGFMTPGDGGKGWKDTHAKAVEWFLKDATAPGAGTRKP